jgi:hypothetical protein
MIRLTDISDTKNLDPLDISENDIESITTDTVKNCTVITMKNGIHYLVEETPGEIRTIIDIVQSEM